MLLWIVSFSSMAILDFVWAWYTVAIQDKKEYVASLYATFIAGINFVIVINYISDHVLLIPTCAGAFVGTLIGVRYERKISEKISNWYHSFVSYLQFSK